MQGCDIVMTQAVRILAVVLINLKLLCQGIETAESGSGTGPYQPVAALNNGKADVMKDPLIVKTVQECFQLPGGTVQN
jgi:hypothetical protein